MKLFYYLNLKRTKNVFYSCGKVSRYNKLVFFIFLLYIFINIFPVKAQNYEPCNCDTTDMSANEPNLFGELYFNPRLSIGSQYYNDDWRIGTVFLSNNEKVENKFLRYNGYLDRLIWLIPDVYQQVKLDKEAVSGFNITNKLTSQTEFFSKIKIKEDLKLDSSVVYAQLLYKNKISLYLYHKIELTGNEQESGTMHFLDVYGPKDTYYFLLNNCSVGFKRLHKKDVYKLFPDKKEELSLAIKSSKIRGLKKVTELIKLTELLNSIL